MSVPTCPNCKAKFSHDSIALACKKCGLPDEVRDKGPKEIARWKRKPWYETGSEEVAQLVAVSFRGIEQSKAERKRMLRRHPARKVTKKHGRVRGR